MAKKLSVKNFEKTLNDHSISSLLIIIIIVFLGGFLLNWLMGGGLYEGNANMTNKLTYYHMDGCGHCKTFNPIWDKFTKEYKGPPHIKFEKIESKDAPSSVKGFPTIVLTKSDGSTSEFNADRTVGELQNFISSQDLK